MPEPSKTKIQSAFISIANYELESAKENILEIQERSEEITELNKNRKDGGIAMIKL